MSREPEPAVRTLVIYRGAHGDPTVEAQLTGAGDLRLLSIQRAGVWAFSDVDTIGWWSWHTVDRADLPRLFDGGADVLEAVRAAVAPVAADDGAVAETVRRFEAWLIDRGVRSTQGSYDEHES
jgi:hypothetical protein